MRREEAELLIGKLVVTSFVHGGARYIGELLKVLPTKPFRAVIKVCAVYDYPALYLHNTIGKFDERRIPLGNSIVSAKGDIINVGNSIEAFKGELPSYKESLISSLQAYIIRVKTTLDKFIATNGNYHTHYIDNLDDSKRLYDLLFERLNAAYGLADD